MKTSKVAELKTGISFNFNLPLASDYRFKSYINEVLDLQKANLQNLKSNLAYLNKRDEILKNFKDEYKKIISPELRRILMKYFSEDENDVSELDIMLKNYNTANDPIGNKLKFTTAYESHSLNEKDAKLLNKINERVIEELYKLFKVQDNGFKKSNTTIETKKWSHRKAPYDCTEQTFIPFHEGGELYTKSQNSDINGILDYSLSWDNHNTKGEGSSIADNESKAWVGIKLKNNNSGKLKAFVRLKCTDYSFAFTSYKSDCIASSFYTNVRNEIVFRINSGTEHRQLINCWTTDINSDPRGIGYYHENHNEDDEMILSFDFDNVIPAESILWIGLRSRVFSFYENLESFFYQKECLKVEEVRYNVQ